jgi:hypothetical protein
MRGIISGTWFYGYALAPLGPRDAIVWATVVLFAVGAVASVVPRRTRSLPVAALALTTLLIGAQILVTSAATAGWHYIEIYPFFFCVVAYGAYSAATIVIRRRAGVVIAVAGATIAMLLYSGALLAKYERALPGDHSNPAWTNAVYKLSAYVRRSGAQVYSADWGIANPLFALHPDRGLHELAFALQSPSSGYLTGLGRWLESLPGKKLFIAHAAGETVFPNSTRALLAMMPHHLRLLTTILGADRKPIYLIYQPG